MSGTPAIFINGRAWNVPSTPADTDPALWQQAMATSFEQALSSASGS